MSRIDSVLSDFSECPQKQSEGSPYYVSDNVTLYVKRWGTPESEEVRRRLHRRLFGPMHQFDDSDDSLLIAHWLVEYGVSGWDIIDEDGSYIEYSKREAQNAFLDESRYLSLNKSTFNFANDWQKYLLEEAEEAIDNIKKP